MIKITETEEKKFNDWETFKESFEKGYGNGMEDIKELWDTKEEYRKKIKELKEEKEESDYDSRFLVLAITEFFLTESEEPMGMGYCQMLEHALETYVMNNKFYRKKWNEFLEDHFPMLLENHKYGI